MTNMQKPILIIAAILFGGYLLLASSLPGLFWLQVFGNMFYYTIIVPACAIALVVVLARNYIQTSKYKKELTAKGIQVATPKRSSADIVMYTLIGAALALVVAAIIYSFI